MATLTTAAWQGVVANDVKVEAPIKATQVINTAEDQARVYEVLTGLDADGSGTATTNAQHDHTEFGNAIVRPLAVWQYGTRGPHNAFVAGNTASAYCGPYTIHQTDTAGKGTYQVVAPILFYVPTASTSRDIVLALECNTDPNMHVTIYDATNTPDSIFANVKLRSLQFLIQDNAGEVGSGTGIEPADVFTTVGALHAANRDQYGIVFNVASAGLYYAVVYYDPDDTNFRREIFGGIIMPCYNLDQVGFVAVPPSSAGIASNRVHVESSWQPIDGNLIETDGPLNAAALCKIAENNAWLYEKATGLPAPGNITSTVAGHTHDGSSSNGAEIEFTLHQCVLGGMVADPGAGTDVFGQHSICPKATSTGQDLVTVGKCYVPKSINTAVGASNVRFAALVYNDGVATNQQRVSATFGSTTLTFADTAGGVAGEFEVLTTPGAGANRFAFTQNTQNTFSVEYRANTITTGIMRLCSYVFYLEA